MTPNGEALAREARTRCLTVEEILLPPHFPVPPHEHEPPHVLVVLAGSLVERTEGGAVACDAGAVRYAPGGDVHDVAIGPAGLHALVLGAPGFPELRLVDRVYVPARAARAEVEALRRVLFEDACASPAAVEERALALFALVRARARTGRERHDRWLAAVRGRLDARDGDGPGNRAPLADAARAARRNAGLVARLFRATHGVSIHRYYRRRQIDRAWRLLADPERPLSAVAADAGFADQSHLTRVLSRELGATPAQLRRRMLGGGDGAHWFRAEPLRALGA